MTWHVRVSGTWREITDPNVRVSGVWQAIQEGWVRVSGAWQQFYNRFTESLADLDGDSISSSTFTGGGSTTDNASVHMGTDGQAWNETNLLGTENYTNDWGRPLTAGIGSSYHCRLTVVSGSSPTSGDAVNSWLQISTERSWELAVTGTAGNSDSGTWKMELSEDGGSTVLESATFTISASIESI